jgi:hypothetical protein
VSKELTDLTVELVHETEKAWLVSQGLKDKDGKQINIWIPKSVGELEPEGNLYILTLPVRYAEDKGLV